MCSLPPDTEPRRRLRLLHRHLTAGRANVRPGDEDLPPVETSYFVAGAFRPRTDEARAVRFDVAGVPRDLVGAFMVSFEFRRERGRWQLPLCMIK